MTLPSVQKRDRLKEMVEIEKLLKYPDGVPRIVEYYDKIIQTTAQAEREEVNLLKQDLYKSVEEVTKLREYMKKTLGIAPFHLLEEKEDLLKAKDKKIQELEAEIKRLRGREEEIYHQGVSDGKED